MFNRFDTFYNSRKCGFKPSYYKQGVNFDYIATISKKSGNTEEVIYKRFPIKQKNKELLEKVEIVCQDDNKTVLDIHNLCVLSIPEYTNKSSFNCCLPYEYYRAYICSNTQIPRVYLWDIEDQESYAQFIDNLKNDFITKSLYKYSLDYTKEHLTAKEYEKIYSSDETRKKWEEEASKRFKTIDELPVDEKSEVIKDEIEVFEEKTRRTHKYQYFDALKFWLLASWYFDTLKLVLEDDSICMYSLEKVGWHSYTYPVHGDFEFKVNTNFGYGSSAYFDIIVKYKGIKILPYSHIVSYYHAHMVNFLSCTRRYYPYRQNWDSCLKYASELINEAYLDETKFIEKWVKKELNIMIKGLKSIMDDPYKYLENCLEHPLDEEKSDRLVTVRNINDRELSYYKIYKHEMTIAFQAEKITDSIRVIDNLIQLSTIIPDILSSIEIIRNLNKVAYPIFQNAIKSISSDIESRNSSIHLLKKELKEIKIQYHKFNEECRNTWKNTKEKHNLEFQEFEKTYILNHKEYEDVLNKKQDIKNSIEELEYDVEKRMNFKFRIKLCTEKIDKFLTT